MTFRIGHGWDAHPLVPGRPCVLGGVRVAADCGPEGHSDGDVVLHALADALLGTSGAGDLGSVFGTDDPRYAGAPSRVFVEEAYRRAGSPAVVNVDVTVVGSRPRLGAARDEIRASIAGLLGVSAGDVSVKFCSGNGLTEFGRGEGISATVLVLVERRNPEPAPASRP